MYMQDRYCTDNRGLSEVEPLKLLLTFGTRSSTKQLGVGHQCIESKRLPLVGVFQVGVAVKTFFVKAEQPAGLFIAQPSFAYSRFDVAA